jgi:dipeptidyl aminopeptidase/acylaminoacyl peptidase
MPATAPYGTWKSPITSSLLVAHSIGLGQIQVDGEDIYWLEMRPEEGGRVVPVHRAPDGQVRDLLAQPWNTRTRVHEYGGGSFLVKEGVLYFSNFQDQRLYQMEPSSEPRPISPAVDLRYADMVLDSPRNRLICVREDHTTGAAQAVNCIVEIDQAGKDIQTGGRILVGGSDFYSTPRISPDGKSLCWLSWNHPNMPWDGTSLWIAEFGPDGGLVNSRQVAGGDAESIFQPSWSPDGQLYFVSDRTGWWNLYRLKDGKPEALHRTDAEFGLPQWGLGMTTYAFLSAEQLICTYFEQGVWHMAILSTRTQDFQPIHLPYTDLAEPHALPGRVLFFAASPRQSTALILLHFESGKTELLRNSNALEVDPGYLSMPAEIEFPTTDGKTAFAYYYPPHNNDFTAPQGELPPLIVKSHGGPTGSTSTSLNLRIQYWTSRGFAVADVNYGGSTGYGRAYRERLNGKWGIVDVDDCANAALFLTQTGRADPNRLAITGGSAGGYTTLCALTFRKVFHAGASYYGISDAEALALDTHKFESRYTDNLIGPYPAARDVYIERSPIHFINQMDCALILFQGSEDRVVPPDQSRKMFEAVRAKELPVAYIEYPGEQHGFRKAENIQRSLDAELYFYGKVFGFTPADEIDPVEIENIG